MSLCSVWARLKPKAEENVLRYAAQKLAVLLPVFLIVGRAVADGAVTVTALLFLADCLRRREWGWLKESWVRLTLALWVWLIVTGLAGDANSSSLVRAAGWIRFPVFAAAMTYWFADRVWFERLIVVTSVALGFVAMDSWLQYLTGNDVFGYPVRGYRLTGPFGKDQQVGIFITKLVFIPALPVLMKAVQDGQKKKAVAVSAALFFLLMTAFVSGERMASLLFLLGAGLTLLLLPSMRRFFLGLVVVAVIGAGILVVTRPALMERQINQTVEVITHFSQSPYGKVWKNGLNVALQHPLFGVGPKNFRHACTCKDGAVCGENDVPCALHPHNIYIEWAAEMGVPGLLGFLVLIGLWLTRMRIAFRLRSLPLYALGGWITVCLGLWPLSAMGSFFSNWNEVLFWLALGIALAGTEMALPTYRTIRSPVAGPDENNSTASCCRSTSLP